MGAAWSSVVWNLPRDAVVDWSSIVVELYIYNSPDPSHYPTLLQKSKIMWSGHDGVCMPAFLLYLVQDFTSLGTMRLHHCTHRLHACMAECGTYI